LPPISVSNQQRRESFFSMLTGGLFRNPVPVSLDRANWEHLKPAKPTEADKGFVAQVQDPRYQWVINKLNVELDRLSTLTDIRVMLDEAPYIDGTCNKFINIVKAGGFNLEFQGGTATRAKRIVNDMLDRIKFRRWRGDYLHSSLFLECFLNRKVSFMDGLENATPEELYKEFSKGMALGRTEGILGPLPPETMFRNSNKQDTFDNPDRAYYQVPEPFNNPAIPIQQNQFKEWFGNIFILHPRWNHKRQKNHKYSRPSLKPLRKAYNRTELSATDAVVQRHLAATRLLVIYLKASVREGEDIGVGEDQMTEFTNTFIQQYPTGFNKPGTVYITSGSNKVESVGDLNITLSKPADIYMHFELMSIGLLLNPLLAGFTGGEGGRVTGPLLEQLRDNLATDLQTVYEFEDEEILLPLCYFELFLNGIFDTEIIVRHEKPPFLKNIERKLAMSEVEAGLMARETYHRLYIESQTNRAWAEEGKTIEAEQKKFGPATATESSKKGVSGSKKEITQPEADSE
jgi:hypothetical protein